MVKTIEGIPDDIGSADEFIGGLKTIRKLKFLLYRLKRLDDSSFISRLIREFKLVQHEADLPQMFYSCRVCVLQETPLAIEYSFEVCLHKRGYTHVLGGFEFARDGETGISESFIDGLAQPREGLREES
jgi:hypothetical protein